MREGTANPSPAGPSLKFKWTNASQDAIIDVLKQVAWDKAGSPIGAEIEYLTRDPRPVDFWCIIAPQIGERGEAGAWRVGDQKLNCISRARFESRFNVFSTPNDVRFAKWLIGDRTVTFSCRELQPDTRRGILLFYPTFEKDSNEELGKTLPAMGFSLALPSTGNNDRVSFRTKLKRTKAVG
jgi:hypothetical protein